MNYCNYYSFKMTPHTTLTLGVVVAGGLQPATAAGGLQTATAAGGLQTATASRSASSRSDCPQPAGQPVSLGPWSRDHAQSAQERQPESAPEEADPFAGLPGMAEPLFQAVDPSSLREPVAPILNSVSEISMSIPCDCQTRISEVSSTPPDKAISECFSQESEGVGSHNDTDCFPERNEGVGSASISDDAFMQEYLAEQAHLRAEQSATARRSDTAYSNTHQGGMEQTLRGSTPGVIGQELPCAGTRQQQNNQQQGNVSRQPERGHPKVPEAWPSSNSSGNVRGAEAPSRPSRPSDQKPKDRIYSTGPASDASRLPSSQSQGVPRVHIPRGAPAPPLGFRRESRGILFPKEGWEDYCKEMLAYHRQINRMYSGKEADRLWTQYLNDALRKLGLPEDEDNREGVTSFLGKYAEDQRQRLSQSAGAGR